MALLPGLHGCYLTLPEHRGDVWQALTSCCSVPSGIAGVAVAEWAAGAGDGRPGGTPAAGALLGGRGTGAPVETLLTRVTPGSAHTPTGVTPLYRWSWRYWWCGYRCQAT